MSYIPNNIKGDITLTNTAYDRKFICTAPSGDYTITLPKIKSSYSGSLIKFVISGEISGTITISAALGDLIDNKTSISIKANQIVNLQNFGDRWSTLTTESSGIINVPTGEVLTNYTNSNPMPEKIGGLESGTTFNNVPLTDLIDGLLYPYQYPVFSSFGFIQDTAVEVGTTISGVKEFSWIIINSSNVSAGTIKIDDFTNSTNLISNVTDSPQSLNIGTISKTSQDTHTWRIHSYNTKGIEFIKDFTVAWRWKIYFGTSFDALLSETQVKALSSSRLSTTTTGTYSFGASGYKYICYPDSLNPIISLKDENTNLEIPYTVLDTILITNSFGVATNYKILRTLNQLGTSINIMVN